MSVGRTGREYNSVATEDKARAPWAVVCLLWRKDYNSTYNASREVRGAARRGARCSKT